MRYSSTLIGMGMRYSLISMAVVESGRLYVCVCVCVEDKECTRVVAPLGRLRYPSSMFKQRGRESSLFTPEERRRKEKSVSIVASKRS